MMKDNPSLIIGYINTALKDHARVFGELTEHRGHAIILALLGDLDAFSPVGKEVLEYMKKHYDFSL